MIQRLNWTEIVAERRFGRVRLALHELPQGEQLRREKNEKPVVSKQRNGVKANGRLTCCLVMKTGLLMMIQVTVS